MSLALEGQQVLGGSVVLDPGIGFRITAVTTLVTGTMFLMWLGEQITERGVGNGISLIIFAGIVAGLPSAVGGTLELSRTGELHLIMVFTLFALAIAVTGFVVFIERGQRRITVNYAQRQVGRKMYAGQSSHLPLKLNMAGVIPPIFASSLILFPGTLASWAGQAREMRWLQDLATLLQPGQPIYVAFYAAGIIFFCFFYTAVVFDPRETADNLKKSGAFIPGMRPGEQTAPLPRRRADETDHGRRHLHHLRVPVAGVPYPAVQRAVLFRRDVAIDYRGRGHGLHGANPGAPDVAPV